MTVMSEYSLPVLVSIRKPFLLCSLPCPAEEGGDRVALVGSWHPSRVNPPQRQRYFVKKRNFSQRTSLCCRWTYLQVNFHKNICVFSLLLSEEQFWVWTLEVLEYKINFMSDTSWICNLFMVILMTLNN